MDEPQRVNDLLVTYTISIGRNGDVTNDTQTHGNSFSDVYRAFHAIKKEVERQINERRACPYNPMHGTEPTFDNQGALADRLGSD